MAFLDEEGLQYYTSKIQSEINAKEDSKFSDGSPNIRVKEVDTSEYNALSEEEKNLPILYLVHGDPASILNDQLIQETNAGISTLEELLEPVSISEHPQSSFTFSYIK